MTKIDPFNFKIDWIKRPESACPGDLYQRDGGVRWEIRMKTLEETSLSVAQALCDP